MARYSSSGGKGQEIIVAVSVTGGKQSNGAKGAGAVGVGRANGVEDLDIGAKLKLHGVEIGARGASYDRQWTEDVGHTVCGGEHVKATYNVGHHGNQQQFGRASEREAVRAGTCALAP